MAHRLNTNKQFMIGNGILAFAVIAVVVVFVYMSLSADANKKNERNYQELYTISLVKGFTGVPIEVHINDSILYDNYVTEEPMTFQVNRFAEESALLIVDKTTESISTFDLNEKGGTYRLEKDNGGVKLLAK